MTTFPNLKFKKNTDKRNFVYINGQELSFVADTLSYEEIIEIVYGDKELQPSVVYKGSAQKSPDGILEPGKSVKIKNGTRFTVILTGNA